MNEHQKARLLRDTQLRALYAAGRIACAAVLPHAGVRIRRAAANPHNEDIEWPDPANNDSEGVVVTGRQAEALLAVRVAGRAAEHVFLRETSQLCEGDLRAAGGLAAAMVTRWGMGADTRLYSPTHPDPAAHNDIRQLLADAHNTATQIITDNRTFVNEIAGVLQSHIIERDDIRAIAQRCALTPWRPQ